MKAEFEMPELSIKEYIATQIMGAILVKIIDLKDGIFYPDNKYHTEFTRCAAKIAAEAAEELLIELADERTA